MKALRLPSLAAASLLLLGACATAGRPSAEEADRTWSCTYECSVRVRNDLGRPIEVLYSTFPDSRRALGTVSPGDVETFVVPNPASPVVVLFAEADGRRLDVQRAVLKPGEAVEVRFRAGASRS